MIHITINEKTAEPEDMALVLHRIADLLEAGYVEGHDPNWYITEHDKEKLDKV